MEESIIVVGYFEHQVYTLGLAFSASLPLYQKPAVSRG
jgi:hypothetical protein